MKIIGKTDNGFILSASKDEVCNLVGYYSQYSNNTPKLEVGTELAVAKMFKHLHSLGSEKHGIAAMAAKLRAAADLIGTLPDPITEASAVPDKKEGE